MKLLRWTIMAVIGFFLVIPSLEAHEPEEDWNWDKDSVIILFVDKRIESYPKALKTDNLDKLTEELSLTPEQRGKIKKILKENEDKAKELEEKLEAIKKEGIKIDPWDPPSKNELNRMIQEKRNKHTRLQEKLYQLVKDTIKKIEEVLTDEQQVKLTNYLNLDYLDQDIDPLLKMEMERVRRVLKLDKDESTIMPQVRKILEHKRDFSTKYQKKLEELREILKNEDEKANLEIKLAQTKKLVEEYQLKRKKLEEELRNLLTKEQEATLLILGFFGEDIHLRKPLRRIIRPTHDDDDAFKIYLDWGEIKVDAWRECREWIDKMNELMERVKKWEDEWMKMKRMRKEEKNKYNDND